VYSDRAKKKKKNSRQSAGDRWQVFVATVGDRSAISRVFVVMPFGR
jgi:hypothetical protein